MLIGEQVSIPADRKLPRRLPKHRFTEPQIIELRTRRAAGESLPSLAKASNTIPEYVSYIATGKIHERVGGPITEPYQILPMRGRLSSVATIHSLTRGSCLFFCFRTVHDQPVEVAELRPVSLPNPRRLRPRLL